MANQTGVHPTDYLGGFGDYSQPDATYTERPRPLPFGRNANAGNLTDHDRRCRLQLQPAEGPKDFAR